MTSIIITSVTGIIKGLKVLILKLILKIKKSQKPKSRRDIPRKNRKKIKLQINKDITVAPEISK